MITIPFYLDQLVAAVPHNSSLRFDCPMCKGLNTLGITKENGNVKWHCFKASCNLKPNKSKYTRGISELKSQLEGATAAKQDFLMPDYLVHGIGSPKALQMIIQGNCVEVYKRGLFDIAYDPVQDRVCFVVKDKNKVVGLIGKACNRKTKPKVLNYTDSDTSCPFIVKYSNWNSTSKILVLVEDCLSAASICRIEGISGLALLGTTLKSEYIPYIKQYDKVIIALDRDARKKALAIKNKLCYYHPSVNLWLLNTDIKEMSDSELTISYKEV